MWYMHVMEYYPAIKKATLLAGTWLQLEIIPLSEVRGTKTNIRGHHLHLESQTGHKRTCLQNGNSVRDTESKLVAANQRGGGVSRCERMYRE